MKMKLLTLIVLVSAVVVVVQIARCDRQTSPPFVTGDPALDRDRGSSDAYHGNATPPLNNDMLSRSSVSTLESAAEPPAVEESRSSAVFYTPTHEELSSYRWLQRMAALVGDELPQESNVAREKWVALVSLERGLSPQANRCLQRRGAMANAIAQRIGAESRRELVGPDIPQSPEERERDTALSRATVPGQIISFWHEGGLKYAVRINPGESAEIDALSVEVESIALMATAGARQILDSR
ncbi:MAG: hypothetical protein JNM25_09095 [Planctomycetes bacterium]|nr:hypothetical protein [Planctomycetota bacterium]